MSEDSGSGVSDSGGNQPPEPPQGKKTQTQGVQLLPLLLKYFKTAGLLFCVWLTGYFKFSSSWIMLGLFFHVVNDEYRKVKDAKKAYAKQAVANEKEAILARTDELPSWVYFPDVERAEWLNKMMKQMWPYIGEYAANLLKTSVEPQVQNSLPKSLTPFKFERVDMGDIPPRIGGVKVYIDNVKRDEIIMDMEIFYASDSHIKVAIRGVNSGIKDLSVHGTVRIVMKPLVNIIPIIGGMSIFFLNPPKVDFDLTDMANMLDVPLLSNTLRTVVEDQIAYYMVLPNKIPIQMAEGVDMTALRYPVPQGVLRLHIVAGRELKAADIKVIGKAKSDPYVKLYVGAQSYKTRVIKDTVNPVWNQYFEAVVDQKHGQFADLEVLDQDPGEDDELGTASIDIEQVATHGTIDTWLPLENVKTGMIHVRGLWLHLSKDPDDLTKEEELRSQRYSDPRSGMGVFKEGKKNPKGTEEHLSSALLLVTLDAAKGLPRSKKSMSEPTPFVKLAVGQNIKKSIPKPKTIDPKWEENFQFLILDPYQQDLDLEVCDSNKNDKRIGFLKINLKTLIAAKDMTVNRPFRLQESGMDSKISLRLCLRILTSELPADWALDTGSAIPDTGSSVDPTADDSQQQTADKPPAPATTTTTTTAAAAAQGGGGGGGQEVETPTQPENNNKDFVVEDTASDLSAEQGLRYRGQSTTSSEGGGGWGRVQLTLRYSVQRSRLIVVIHKCENLKGCDDDNLSDPYVRFYLHPDKSKKKTQTVKNDLNPIYDETFEWSLSLSETQSRSLEVSVKNNVSLFSSSRTHIGQCVIELGQMNLTNAHTGWFDLQDPDINKDTSD